MKKTTFFLILALVLVVGIVIAAGGDYMDYISVGQGNTLWCQLTGCTITDLTVKNLTIDNGTVTFINKTVININVTGTMNVDGDISADNFIGTHLGNSSIWNRSGNEIIPSDIGDSLVVPNISSDDGTLEIKGNVDATKFCVDKGACDTAYIQSTDFFNPSLQLYGDREIGFSLTESNTAIDFRNDSVLKKIYWAPTSGPDVDLGCSSIGCKWNDLYLQGNALIGSSGGTTLNISHNASSGLIKSKRGKTSFGGDAIDGISNLTVGNNAYITATLEAEQLNSTDDAYIADRLGIGRTAPLYPLDIVGFAGNLMQIRLSSSSADTTPKAFGLTAQHYDTDEEDIALLYGLSGNGLTELRWGGGSGAMNVPTNQYFYASADSTTVSGSIIFDLDIDGFTLQTGNMDLTGGNISVGNGTFSGDLSVGNNITSGGLKVQLPSSSMELEEASIFGGAWLIPELVFTDSLVGYYGSLRDVMYLRGVNSNPTLIFSDATTVDTAKLEFDRTTKELKFIQAEGGYFFDGNITAENVSLNDLTVKNNADVEINITIGNVTNIGTVGNQLKIWIASASKWFDVDSGIHKIRNLADAQTTLAIVPYANRLGVIQIDGVAMFAFKTEQGYADVISSGDYDYYIGRTSGDGDTPAFRHYGTPTGESTDYLETKAISGNSMQLTPKSGNITINATKTNITGGLSVDGNITTTASIKNNALNSRHYFGDNDDGYFEHDGNSLNIVANNFGADDALQINANSVWMINPSDGLTMDYNIANTAAAGSSDEKVAFTAKTLPGFTDMGKIVMGRADTYVNAPTSMSYMEFYTTAFLNDVLALRIDENQDFNFSNNVLYNISKVGIGIDNPTSELHVVGDGNITGGLSVGGGFGDTGVTIYDNGNASFDGILTNIGNVYLNNTLNVVDGSVGIGTISPNSTFHIKADVPGTVGSHSAGQLIIQNPADTVWSNVIITAYESDGSGNPDQQLWYLGSASTGNSDITFLNRRNSKLTLGTSGTSRLTILGNGNVGIGNTDPNSTLDVSGNTMIRGDLNVTGNITGNQIYGQAAYHNHTATEINFAVDGKFYNMTFNLDIGSYLNGFTTDGTHSLTAQVAGLYDSKYFAIGDGQNNHKYVAHVAVNDEGINYTETHKKMAAGGDIVTMNGGGYIQLDVGDQVSLQVADDGGTGIGNYYGMNLRLDRVGD